MVVSNLKHELNREAWLTAVGHALEPMFSGFKLLPYKVTCGWPCKGGLGLRRRVVGECHDHVVSEAGLHEIFISPTIAKSLDVAGVLAHEITHVAAGHEAGHGPGFVKVCKHVGLTKGKPTTVMPGPKLEIALMRIILRVGEYPHAAIKLKGNTKGKTPSSLKLECSCGCTIRMTRKMLTDFGAPTCTCGHKFFEETKEGE